MPIKSPSNRKAFGIKYAKYPAARNLFNRHLPRKPEYDTQRLVDPNEYKIDNQYSRQKL